MNKLRDPRKDTENQKNSQFSEGGIFVREDDQDWGSAGMNNIKQDLTPLNNK